MAEPITMQKLTDASIDADTLGGFVNGDEYQEILTRLGEKYPSLKNAIRQIINNGILSATNYETYAEMTAEQIPDGDYAKVVNDGDTSLNGIYLKTSSGFEFISLNVTYEKINKGLQDLLQQSLDANSTIQDGVISEYTFAIIDKDNNVGLAITSDGKTDIVRTHEQYTGEHTYNNDLSFGICDADNNVIAGVNADGGVWFKPSEELINSILNTKTVNPSDIKFAERVLMPVAINTSAVKFLSDKNGLNAYIQRTDIDSDTAMLEPQNGIIYIPAAGQSLSIGGGATENGSNTEDYIFTKQAPLPNHALMFNDGTRGAMYRNLNESAIVDFVPAYEQFNNENQGETQGSGLMRGLHSHNANNVYVYRSHGAGGRTIAELSKGGSTPAYINGLKELNKAIEIASKYAQSIVCYAFTWTQGEQDRGQGTSFNEYKNALITLIDNYRNDYAGILPSNNPQLHCIIDQLSASTNGEGSDIELAQYAVAEELSYAHISTPKYFMTYSENLHLQPKWYSILGEYQARCYDALFISKTGWKPLKPKTISNVSGVIDITFDVPVGSLVFDTANLELAENYGFNVSDDGGAVITDVQIVESDTVRLTLDKPTTNAYVSYAHNGIELGEGSHSGAWGNLHDSDDTPSLTDPSVILYNWCLTFKESI